MFFFLHSLIFIMSFCSWLLGPLSGVCNRHPIFLLLLSPKISASRSPSHNYRYPHHTFKPQPKNHKHNDLLLPHPLRLRARLGQWALLAHFALHPPTLPLSARRAHHDHPREGLTRPLPPPPRSACARLLRRPRLPGRPRRRRVLDFRAAGVPPQRPSCGVPPAARSCSCAGSAW
jgi:hypothetical protein